MLELPRSLRMIAAIGLLAGCARLGLEPAASPATTSEWTRPGAASIAGAWDGVIDTDNRAAAFHGVSNSRATLTINDDGTWSGRTKLGNSRRLESGTVQVAGSEVVLEGTVVEGDGAGKPVRHVLTRYGNRLYGWTEQPGAPSSRLPIKLGRSG